MMIGICKLAQSLFRCGSSAHIFNAIVLAFACSISQADPLPDYEGVYLETKSGALIQVPPLSSSFKSFRASPNFTIVQPFTIDDVENAPVVDADDLVGIIVNSRSERINRLNMVVRAGDFLGPYVSKLGVHARNMEAIGGFKFKFAEAPNYQKHLVVGTWGWGREAFRIKNIDQFNTKYELNNAQYQLSVRFNSGVLGGTKAGEIEVFGFAVQTDQANYIFFTPKMRTAYQSILRSTNKTRVVYFWASWCEPCKIDIPHIKELLARGARVEGIGFKDNLGAAVQFLDQHGLSFTELRIDEHGELSRKLAVTAVPHTFVLDGNSTIIASHAGPMTKSILASKILPALGNSGE